MIDAHFHADFVAGHLEVPRPRRLDRLRRAAEAEYDPHLSGGERISLGDVAWRSWRPRAHAESISVLVSRADDEVPYAVLTGDALFIGDVGRPDLLASIGFTAEELGSMLTTRSSAS